ncbi:hypothetical protein D3C87_914390 [compost metagenome]
MKKIKISMETNFWATYEIEDPFELINAFFNYCTVDSYKNTLNEVMLYVYRAEVCNKERPGDVFDFHTAVRSFIRGAYLLTFKSKRWKVKEVPEQWQIISQASLNKEEYQDPFLVFVKAFKCKTLDEYEFFLNEIVHVSLSPYREEFDYDLITPHIYLVKMLDAAQILSERGVTKIKEKMKDNSE